MMIGEIILNSVAWGIAVVMPFALLWFTYVVISDGSLSGLGIALFLWILVIGMWLKILGI